MKFNNSIKWSSDGMILIINKLIDTFYPINYQYIITIDENKIEHYEGLGQRGFAKGCDGFFYNGELDLY